MIREIERKFLVTGDFISGSDIRNIFEMKQGYLSKTKGRTVRVRFAESKKTTNTSTGVLTIKVKGDEAIAGVDEYEYSIPADEAFELISHCDSPIIEKTRYIIKYEGRYWDVDQFHGHKEGLIMAEIELEDINEVISLPSWIGEEVTGKPEYYNANM